MFLFDSRNSRELQKWKIKHQMLKFWNNFLQQLFLTRTLLEDKVVSMDNNIFLEQILMNLRNKDLYIQNPNPN